MATAEKISPQSVREKLEAGMPVLFVCAYEDDQKCRNNLLKDSILYSELEDRKDDLAKDREIVFY